MAASVPDEITVRTATSDDLQAVADIYRHYVENTVATFDTQSPSAAEWAVKHAHITEAHRPFVVAEDGDDVIGFAYLGPFRAKAAWDRTAEHTIYVRPGCGGRGVGSALLSAVLAAPGDVRQAVAIIAADGGEASLALHAKHGFVEAGRLRAVGHKFGREIDVVLMQRDLRRASE